VPAELKGMVVLITGASSGFGEDSARLFARQGCKVVLAARRLDRLQNLAESIRAEGGEALAVPVDVAEHASIELMVQSALDVYGQIDILFNNAGFGRLDWFDQLNPGRDIETQVDVNLLGLIHVTRAVVPHMIARRGGHIINMASVAAWIAAPLYTLYSATKFGVRGFSDALRRDLAPFGIRVSLVCPGPARTEFGEHTGDHPLKRMSRLRRSFPPMSSAEVARRVVALARRPRRVVMFPWFYHVAVWADWYAPWLVDWLVYQFLTRRRRRASDGQETR
jgi:NADP-dependent 3-hydroxy acid dehydrogenase YdfG